jgi:hypothetical protein
MGIRLQDGSVVAPEIQLVETTGQSVPFEFVGFSNSELFFESERLPRGTAFSELRIRSSKPLTCSNIEWISYMPRTTKSGEP